MMRSLVFLLTLLSVTACVNKPVNFPVAQPRAHLTIQSTGSLADKLTKGLPFYVQKAMNNLINNTVYVTPESVIAVTSFVFTDGNFQDSPVFAGQLKESFIFEFNKLGQPIIELRASGMIQVTNQGEFFLSRDYQQLRADQPVDYLLVGTLSQLKDGVLLNARLVGSESFAVVGASQTFIPKSAIENYISSGETSTAIKLIKG